MHYSILIYGVEGVSNRLSPEEQEELIQGHRDLQEALAARGNYGTVRLMPTSNAVTLKPTTDAGQKPLVIDGPFAETKEQLLGFYIADFDALDEAITFAERIASPYVRLEVRPVAWAGGILGEA